MPEGTVKWFNNKKGYGFIVLDDGEDIFVHYADIEGEGFRGLGVGERVSFEILEGEKGRRAKDVVKVGQPK